MNKHTNITAIIYDKRGNVLSIGKNSYVKTHPLQARFAKKMNEEHRIYLHAEIHAIVRCKTIENAHRMVITRFGADGKPALSKPCRICEAAIREFGIKNIEHT